ncbi:MAG: hypothetical protein LBB80_10525 [Treponema sp.]|jgi:preprotein translocase subunit SecY|nr:hypothetical protein [Treponema sp.]
MISNELKNLLFQTITSWQVIGVTLGLIVYFSLVSYVVRFRRKVKVEASKAKPKPKKENKKAPSKSEDELQDEE